MKRIRQKVSKEKSWQQKIFGHMCRSFHCKDITQKGIIFTSTVGNKKTWFLQNFPSHGMLRNRMRNWKEMSRWELWSWWVGWWPQLSFSISAMRWWQSSCAVRWRWAASFKLATVHWWNTVESTMHRNVTNCSVFAPTHQKNSSLQHCVGYLIDIADLGESVSAILQGSSLSTNLQHSENSSCTYLLASLVTKIALA